MKKINKKILILNSITILFSALYIVLGCMPNGIRMDFFGGFVEYHPYFSAMPYGYGNIFPLFIEILAIVNIILLVVSIFVSKKGLQVAKLVLTSIILLFNLVEFIFTTTPTAINIAMFAIALAHLAYEVAIAIVKPNKKYPSNPELDKHLTYQEFCEQNLVDYNEDGQDPKVIIPKDYDD